MSDPYRRPDPPAGAPNAQAEAGELSTWESSHACPDCSKDQAVRLFLATKHGVAIAACGACGGAWIAKAQAMTLFDDGTGAGTAVELASIADAHATLDAMRATSSGERRCVDCDAPLVPRTLHGVIVDVCGEHGVWLDRGEIRRAIAGMTRATAEEHTARPDGGTADLEARGHLNGFLRALASEVIRG